jgi:type-F conjugative transfer system pilin assembly protein TrbC
LIFFNALTGLQAFAEEGFMPSHNVMTHAMKQSQQIQKESAKLIYEKSCHSQKLEQGKIANQGCVKNITHSISEKDKATQILVFVSFSMPELSLKSLFQESPSHNAVLVMRGLYEDSFVKAAQKLQTIGVTIDINPELFESHNITSVPTFVLLTDDQPTHKLKGNVTLNFVAAKFRGRETDIQSSEVTS